jgi:hypothetical protein
VISRRKAMSGGEGGGRLFCIAEMEQMLAGLKSSRTKINKLLRVPTNLNEEIVDQFDASIDARVIGGEFRDKGADDGTRLRVTSHHYPPLNGKQNCEYIVGCVLLSPLDEA